MQSIVEDEEQGHDLEGTQLPIFDAAEDREEGQPVSMHGNPPEIARVFGRADQSRKAVNEL